MSRPGALEFALALLVLVGAAARSVEAGGQVAVYVGTYTAGSESKGIYRFTLDLATGALTAAGEPAPSVNPSFLAFHPSGRFLYAVNEVAEFEGTKAGAVSAFAIEPGTGVLTLLNQQSSKGPGPCHLSVDKAGRHVLVANYDGGSVAVLPVEQDGRLGPASAFVQHEGSSVNSRRQEGPHAHWIDLDLASKLAFVADLGLDKVLVYRYDAGKGTLVPHVPAAASVAPGAGPRHLAFDRSREHAYVINELDSTITVFEVDAKAGVFKSIATVSTRMPLAEGDNLTAEIAVSPDGRFLYGSNRGDDDLAIFAIDSVSGTLAPVGHQATLGKTPRNFAIDPTGAYLVAANQGSDSLVVFRIAHGTGLLSPVGEPVRVPRPVCVAMRAEQKHK